MDARDPAKVVDQVRLQARAIKSRRRPIREDQGCDAIVLIQTLMSHGVAAACKAAFSGFDSPRRLDTINCRFGLHLKNVLCLNPTLVERVTNKPPQAVYWAIAP